MFGGLENLVKPTIPTFPRRLSRSLSFRPLTSKHKAHMQTHHLVHKRLAIYHLMLGGISLNPQFRHIFSLSFLPIYHPPSFGRYHERTNIHQTAFSFLVFFLRIRLRITTFRRNTWVNNMCEIALGVLFLVRVKHTIPTFPFSGTRDLVTAVGSSL